MAKRVLSELTKKKPEKKKSKSKKKKGKQEQQDEAEKKDVIEEDVYSFAGKDEIKEGHLIGSLMILRRGHLEALLTPTLKDRYHFFKSGAGGNASASKK